VALRQEQTKPAFDDLEIWLKEQLSKTFGKSPLAKAICYIYRKESAGNDSIMTPFAPDTLTFARSGVISEISGG